jgi:hypothetical protein
MRVDNGGSDACRSDLATHVARLCSPKGWVRGAAGLVGLSTSVAYGYRDLGAPQGLRQGVDVGCETWWIRLVLCDDIRVPLRQLAEVQ